MPDLPEEEEVFVTKSISDKVLPLIGGFIVFNLLLLDGLFLYLYFRKPKQEIIKVVEKESEDNKVSEASCSESCLTVIKEATSSQSLASSQKSQSGSTNTFASQSVPKETYIPIGTGVSKALDWEDVVGAQVYVNSKSYGKTKKVTFEATVRVPDRVEDVYVRLYNATDQHPVWFSDLFFPSGTTSNFLISDPIQLDEGNKLYKVQMKTQLKSEARLDLARFHIVSE